MAGFFYPNQVESPEQIERKRELATALMLLNRKPQNVGEGFAALTAGLAAGVLNRRADRAYEAGMASRRDLSDKIKGALFGGGQGAFPPPPPPNASTRSPFLPQAPAAAPMDYPSQRVSQAFGDNDIKGGIVQTASALGIDPVDLATAVSYETAGTFDPTKRGPTTQWGQHRGLIQFGEPQAKKYGVDWSNPVGSQLGPDGAVAKYLRDTGVKPGMGMLDIYSAINAGGVGRYGASDANNGGAPGTVADKVNNQMAGHRKKAMALLGAGQPQATAAAGAPVQMAQADMPEMAGNVQPRQQQAGGLDSGILFDALNNPWLDPTLKPLVQGLIDQQLQARDPYRQLQIKALEKQLKQGESLINVGGGQLYDPNTGKWITAPGSGQADIPETVQALDLRAQRAGLQPGTAEYNEFMISGGRGGTSLTVGPDGTVQFSQGGGKPLTEAQSKDTTFATRAAGALPILDKFADALTDPVEAAAEFDPTGLARRAQSPEFQQARQAADEFLQAILRKDTGAAITKDEMAEYGRTYLPRPGDGPEVLAQKRTARARALAALQAGMTPEAILRQERALERSGGGSKDSGGEVPEGVDPELWQYMTPEERRAFQ